MEQAFFEGFDYFMIFEKVFDEIENIITKGIEMCKKTSSSHEDVIILWERNLKEIQDAIEKGNKKYEGGYILRIYPLFYKVIDER